MIFRKRELKIKQPVLNAIILGAAIFLLLYVILQLFGSAPTIVSTQKTQKVTDTDYSYATGYIFRDEQVLTASSGVVDRLVSDGERVKVGQSFVNLYRSSGKGQKELDDIQKDIDSLSSRIEMLSSGVAAKTGISDLFTVNESLSRSYYDYVDKIAHSEISAAEAKGEQLLSALVDYKVITGRDGLVESTLSALKQEKMSLLSSLGAYQSFSADEYGFYYFYNTDGYENILSSKALEGLTAEGLNALISTDPTEYSGLVIGKTAQSAKWYMAVPISEAESFSYSVGRTYPVSFIDADRTINMLLDDMYIGDDGVYLLFSSYDNARSYDLSRAQNIKIELDSVSGYRIPREALVNLNGENGVYILVGSQVEFRRVTIVSNKGTHYIANTYEEDAEENNISPIPHLKTNDLIITSGNDLYDGKRLD